jgi:hypothetical protein
MSTGTALDGPRVGPGVTIVQENPHQRVFLSLGVGDYRLALYVRVEQW